MALVGGKIQIRTIYHLRFFDVFIVTITQKNNICKLSLLTFCRCHHFKLQLYIV